jgi:hypothetical protein
VRQLWEDDGQKTRELSRLIAEREFLGLVLASALSRICPPLLSKKRTSHSELTRGPRVMTTMEHHDAEGPEEAM